MILANREKEKAKSNPLKALHDEGQAVWLDFLSRRFLIDNGLKQLIEHDGLTGVTSNPSIFEKAIAESKDYDRPGLQGRPKRGSFPASDMRCTQRSAHSRSQLQLWSGDRSAGACRLFSSQRKKASCHPRSFRRGCRERIEAFE